MNKKKFTTLEVLQTLVAEQSAMIEALEDRCAVKDKYIDECQNSIKEKLSRIGKLGIEVKFNSEQYEIQKKIVNDLNDWSNRKIKETEELQGKIRRLHQSAELDNVKIQNLKEQLSDRESALAKRKKDMPYLIAFFITIGLLAGMLLEMIFKFFL